MTPHTFRSLLEPFYPAVDDELISKFTLYLDLLLRWNQRTNLTAVRSPEEIVVRHFGESLFAGRHVQQYAATLLDLGSGAGFPGIPIQLAHPNLRVTLAESQGKKAAFLREAVRSLDLGSEVWSQRAELLSPRVFDVVTLRAVDRPDAALLQAQKLLAEGGEILHLTTHSATDLDGLRLPGAGRSVLRIYKW